MYLLDLESKEKKNGELIMYNRHEVYNACLLASIDGIDCLAFGNACDRSNRGEFQRKFYQDIAEKYSDTAKALGADECWKRYAQYKLLA